MVSQQWNEQNDWLNHQQDGDYLLFVQRFDKAEEAFKTAIKKAQDARFKDARLARSLTGLGRAYSNRRQWADAIKQYDQALAIKQKSYGEFHYDVADILTERAFAKISLGQVSEARSDVQEANQIYTKLKSPSSTELLFVDAVVSQQEGDQKAAEKKLKDATTKYLAQIDLQRYPQSTKSLRIARDCGERYATLLEVDGRKDEAKAYRARMQPVNDWMMILGESGV
jgi:tetratricopeptide (TPR) repeat protein